MNVARIVALAPLVLASMAAMASCSDAPKDASTSQPPPTVPDPQTIGKTLACGAITSLTLEETDTLVVHAACDGGPATSVDGLPEGATFDAGAVTWTPRLDQAGSFAFVLVGANGERTTAKGMVLDRFDAPGNAPVANPATYPEEHGLPVFHLTWHSDVPTYCQDKEERDAVPADIMVDGVSFAGAELRCRGATSLAFPKKSFTLRFAKDATFHGPPSLAMFDGRRRLVLTQTFDDVLQLRTRLAFELWNRLDPSHVRVDHASAVVFIDGKYNGLYQVNDNIGDHFLEARGLDKKSNVYKSVEHAGNLKTTFNGATKNPIWYGYEKDDGEPADDFSDLESLIRWTSESTNTDFEATVDQRLATDEFLDWYVLTFALYASDNFGKNAYLVHDVDGPDTRFHYLPWDLNATFGQIWNTRRLAFDAGGGRLAAQEISNNGVWERIAASPTLTARLDDRMRKALAGAASREQVLALFDAMVEEVRASAYRDDRKWDADRRSYWLWSDRTDFTTFDGEVAYVRQWIEQRWDYLATLWPAK